MHVSKSYKQYHFELGKNKFVRSGNHFVWAGDPKILVSARNSLVWAWETHVGAFQEWHVQVTKFPLYIDPCLHLNLYLVWSTVLYQIYGPLKFLVWTITSPCEVAKLSGVFVVFENICSRHRFHLFNNFMTGKKKNPVQENFCIYNAIFLNGLSGAFSDMCCGPSAASVLKRLVK